MLMNRIHNESTINYTRVLVGAMLDPLELGVSIAEVHYRVDDRGHHFIN